MTFSLLPKAQRRMLSGPLLFSFCPILVIMSVIAVVFFTGNRIPPQDQGCSLRRGIKCRYFLTFSIFYLYCRAGYAILCIEFWRFSVFFGGLTMKCCTKGCRRKAIGERVLSTVAVPVCFKHMWESYGTWREKVSLRKLYSVEDRK